MGEKNRESGFVCLRSRLSDNALKQTKQPVGLFIGAACKEPISPPQPKKEPDFYRILFLFIVNYTQLTQK